MDQQQQLELLQTTNFDKKELGVVVERFYSLKPVASSAGVERIDRQHFRDLLSKQFGLTESLLMDRVFKCFDLDGDNYLSLGEFVRGMSIFLKGKFEDHIKFCHKVYDLNGDRYISKEEMFQMVSLKYLDISINHNALKLQNCFVRALEEDEDGIKDIVDLLVKKMDEDRDGRVNEQDFALSVQKDPLILEALGQCLPDLNAVDKFLERKHDLDGDCYPNDYDSTLFSKRSSSPTKLPSSANPNKDSKKGKLGMAM